MQTKIIVGFFLIQLLVASQSWAIRSGSELERFLKDNKIESTSQLWGDYYIYKSRSLQDASFEHPRILHVAENAKFIMAFNQEPSQKGFNIIEFMEFKDDTKKFEFGRIDLRQTDPALRYKPIMNPPLCLTCHRQNARPNWEDYPFWPGVYGSIHGMSGGHDFPLFEERMIEKYNKHYGQITRMDNAGGPNGKLTEQLQLLNFQRIARILKTEIEKSGSLLTPYKYAIVGILACGTEGTGGFEIEDLLTPKALEKLSAIKTIENIKLEMVLAKMKAFRINFKFAKAALNNENINIRGYSIGDDDNCYYHYSQSPDKSIPFEECLTSRGKDLTSKLRYVIEGNGVDMSDWSMNLLRGTYSFNAGYIDISNLIEYLLPELGLQVELELRTTNLWATNGGRPGRYPPYYKYFTPTKEFCTTVKEKSRDSLRAAGF